jgi:hypothetical protein
MLVFQTKCGPATSNRSNGSSASEEASKSSVHHIAIAPLIKASTCLNSKKLSNKYYGSACMHKSWWASNAFQFFLDDKSWRASIQRYPAGKTRYVHFRQTYEHFADSGWHCSFYFCCISDFVFKMQAYSHAY